MLHVVHVVRLGLHHVAVTVDSSEVHADLALGSSGQPQVEIAALVGGTGRAVGVGHTVDRHVESRDVGIGPQGARHLDGAHHHLG